MTVKGSGPHLTKFLLSNCHREFSRSSFATINEYEELFFMDRYVFVCQWAAFFILEVL